MSTKYLLPCRCGQTITIDRSQAGQQVTCACGQSQEAPTLRAMQKLAPAGGPAAAAASPSKPTWTQEQGWLFGTGAVLAILALCVAAYCVLVAREIDVQPAKVESPEELERLFSSWTVDEVYDGYIVAREEGIGEYPTPYIVRRREVLLYYNVALAAGGVAVLGAAMAIASFFWRPRPAPTKRRR